MGAEDKLEEPEETEKKKRALIWTLIGIGVAAAIAIVLLLVMGNGEEEEPPPEPPAMAVVPNVFEMDRSEERGVGQGGRDLEAGVRGGEVGAEKRVGLRNRARDEGGAE